MGNPAAEAPRAAKAPVTKAQTSLGLRWFDFKTVNQGLSQFDRVVDNNKLGAGDGELIRLIQG